MVHTFDKSGTEFPCPECGKVVTKYKYLRSHLKRKLKIKKEKNKECELCGKCFTTNHDLKFHGRKHKEGMPFQCDICLKFFKTPRYVEKHRTQVHSLVDTVSCS